ncbi:MAG: hypothetical protein U9N38_01450 [Thermodesulfobacteriota bacterium]|nr:hypothetical protein [Thermodesulfobacteriota bacterium]
MELTRQKILDLLESIETPIIILEDSSEQIDCSGVLTSEGVHPFDSSDYQIEGPFKVLSDRYENIINILDNKKDEERYWDFVDWQRNRLQQ